MLQKWNCSSGCVHYGCQLQSHLVLTRVQQYAGKSRYWHRKGFKYKINYTAAFLHSELFVEQTLQFHTIWYLIETVMLVFSSYKDCDWIYKELNITSFLQSYALQSSISFKYMYYRTRMFYKDCFSFYPCW